MNIRVKVSDTSSVGFLVGISAWSITFLTLIWGYLFYRLRADQWLVDYISPKILTAAIINTAVLLASSWALHRFIQKRDVAALMGGLLLGALFLIRQWDLWAQLLKDGLSLSGSIPGSFLYLLTGFHALHILLGLLILLPLGVRISRNARDEQGAGRFLFALRFWDLLMLFWVVLLVLIFVLK